MKKKIETTIKIVVSAAILFFLVYKVGISQIYTTFLTFNPIYLVALFALLAVSMIVGALNIKLVFNALNINIGFPFLTLLFTKSWVISLILPGKIGSIPLIYLLRKRIKIAKSAVAVFVDSILTYIVMFIIFALAWFNFFGYDSGLKILGFLVVAITGFLVMASPWGRRIISTYILRKHAQKFQGFAKDLTFLIKKKKVILFLNFLITVIKVNLNALSHLVAFTALGIQVPYTTILLVYVLSLAVAAIPISVSGLGVREAAGVILYTQVGVNAEISTVMFLATTLMTFIFALIAFASIDTLKTYTKSD